MTLNREKAQIESFLWGEGASILGGPSHPSFVSAKRKYRKLKRLSEKKGMSFHAFLKQRAKKKSLETANNSVGTHISFYEDSVTYLGEVLGIWKDELGKQVALKVLGVVEIRKTKENIKFLEEGSQVLLPWTSFWRRQPRKGSLQTYSVTEAIERKIQYLQEFNSSLVEEFQKNSQNYSQKRVDQLTRGRLIKP